MASVVRRRSVHADVDLQRSFAGGRCPSVPHGERIAYACGGPIVRGRLCVLSARVAAGCCAWRRTAVPVPDGMLGLGSCGGRGRPQVGVPRSRRRDRPGCAVARERRVRPSVHRDHRARRVAARQRQSRHVDADRSCPRTRGADRRAAIRREFSASRAPCGLDGRGCRALPGQSPAGLRVRAALLRRRARSRGRDPAGDVAPQPSRATAS
jgi:hypothetical protein